jgi:hypothetical protein
MTHDDSFQIAAASSARRRALARMRRRESASRTQRWVTSPIPAMAERRPRDRGDRLCDGTRNFPPCKALKTHKMRKESQCCANPSAGRRNVSRRRGRRGLRWQIAVSRPPLLFGSTLRFPGDSPLVGSGQQRFPLGKTKPMVPCLNVAQRSRPPFAAPGWPFEPPRRRKNLEVDTLGLEPL